MCWSRSLANVSAPLLAMLTDINELQESCHYEGGTSWENVIDAIADLETAYDKAELTELQRERLRLYYFEQKTFKEIAELQGVAITSIQKGNRSALQRVSTVYKMWEAIDNA